MRNADLEDDIAMAIVSSGLTFTIEEDPVYMREVPLNDVVNAVMSVIEGVIP